MEIKGIEIFNSNDYDNLYIDDDIVVISREKPRDKSNFTQVGIGFVDDEFLQLSDEEQVKRLVAHYLLDSNINGVSKGKNEFAVFAGRRLYFGDRKHDDLEKAILAQYRANRKSFLSDSINNFNEYNFSERFGYSFYSNMGAIDCDTPCFILETEYDDELDFVCTEEEKEFFFEAVDMISGDKEVSLDVFQFVDEDGEVQVKSSTITDGTNTINLHYLLTDLAIEAVYKHNEKIKEGKKLQMKMEGF